MRSVEIDDFSFNQQYLEAGEALDVVQTELSDTTSELALAFSNSLADQVILLIDWNSYTPLSFGVSELETVPSMRNLTLVGVNTQWRYTGPHELAHNHGCRHENSTLVGGPGGLQTFAKGAIIDGTPDGSTEGSVLAAAASNGISSRRLPYFSNPEVFWQGLPTGAFDRDNARQLEESACFVSNLTVANENLCITGTTGVFVNENILITATGQCRDGTVGQIEWFLESITSQGSVSMIPVGTGPTLNFTPTSSSAGVLNFVATMQCDGDAVPFVGDFHSVIVRPQKEEDLPCRWFDYEERVAPTTTQPSYTLESNILIIELEEIPSEVFISDLLGRTSILPMNRYNFNGNKLNLDLAEQQFGAILFVTGVSGGEPWSIFIHE